MEGEKKLMSQRQLFMVAYHSADLKDLILHLLHTSIECLIKVQAQAPVISK
jgi:hypothetical protein